MTSELRALGMGSSCHYGSLSTLNVEKHKFEQDRQLGDISRASSLELRVLKNEFLSLKFYDHFY